MKRVGLLCIAIVSLLAASVPTSLGADEHTDPSPGDLASLAKRLESGAAGVRSLQARVIVNRIGQQGLALDIRVADSGPSWLVVSDIHDGTPLLICADGRALIYDLPHANVRLFDSAHFDCLLGGSNQTIDFAFSLTTGPNRVVLDVPGLIACGDRQPTSSRQGPLWMLTGRTPRGGRLVAHLDLRETFPYTDLGFYAAGSDIPSTAIGPIEVNQPAKPPIVHLPDAAAVAAKLRVVRLPKAADTLASRQEEIVAALGTEVLRVALREPGARAEALRKYGSQIDWPRMAERDRQLSAVLRELVGRSSSASTQPTTLPAG